MPDQYDVSITTKLVLFSVKYVMDIMYMNKQDLWLLSRTRSAGACKFLPFWRFRNQKSLLDVSIRHFVVHRGSWSQARYNLESLSRGSPKWEKFRNHWMRHQRSRWEGLFLYKWSPNKWSPSRVPWAQHSSKQHVMPLESHIAMKWATIQ